MNVAISNVDHPEYGVATIPLPIPDDEYAKCMEILAELEVGGVLDKDCKIEEIKSGYNAMDALVGTQVNIDELDYLAKRLESFFAGEDAQFEAMAYLRDLHTVQDLINLTFCCQQATVISNFGNLEEAGKDHYLNIHGGSATTEEVKKLDGTKLARELIESGHGKITPFGLAFDNGMKMEPLYKGQEFPAYCYEPKMLDVEVEAFGGDGSITFLQVPMPPLQMERMLQRGGIGVNEEFHIDIQASSCPAEVFKVIKSSCRSDMESGGLRRLNDMCWSIHTLTAADQKKLAAVVEFAGPEYPFQVRHLAENLDQFDYVPGVKTATEYGRWMIEQSGRFEYDPNLDEYYDYEKYGNDHIARQVGQFSNLGYVSYHGMMSIDELMMEENPAQGQGMQMGGY